MWLNFFSHPSVIFFYQNFTAYLLGLGWPNVIASREANAGVVPLTLKFHAKIWVLWHHTIEWTLLWQRNIACSFKNMVFDILRYIWILKFKTHSITFNKSRHRIMFDLTNLFHSFYMNFLQAFGSSIGWQWTNKFWSHSN